MKIAAVLITCCMAALVSPSVAAEAPARLWGKTISASYVSSTPYISSEGRGVGSRTVARLIYISTEGRIFVRATHRGITQEGPAARALVRETEPGQGNWEFVGGSLVTSSQTISGAVRVEIRFDSTFQSCSVSGVIGHESGQPYKWKGLNGRQYEAAGPGRISGGRCSISSGNAL
jgi:hypothetical protein